MRVTFPVIKSNIFSNFSLKGHIGTGNVCDKFVMSNQHKFQYIKLKGAEKFYNANFTPSDKNYGDYTFKTFVFDNDTGEPVEMVIKPILFNEFEEEFIMLDPNPNNFDKNGGSIVMGNLVCSLNRPPNDISLDSIASYANEKYSLIGFNLQKAAIERMFMMKRNGIELISVPSAYMFHKNCGYEPVKEDTIMNENEFNEKIDEYAGIFNLDKSITEELIVYKRFFHYLLDENLSCANLLEYTMENNINIKGCPTIRMKLSDGANDEWKQIIKKHRTFKGSRLPLKMR